MTIHNQNQVWKREELCTNLQSLMKSRTWYAKLWQWSIGTSSQLPSQCWWCVLWYLKQSATESVWLKWSIYILKHKFGSPEGFTGRTDNSSTQNRIFRDPLKSIKSISNQIKNFKFFQHMTYTVVITGIHFGRFPSP